MTEYDDLRVYECNMISGGDHHENSKTAYDFYATGYSAVRQYGCLRENIGA